MDDLIKQVAAKTGLSPEMARTAVDTVLGFLKERLPAPIASQIDGLLVGQDAGGDALGALGGLLGKK
jgi:uncharacterized protein (DUF2267 family)